MKKVGIVGYGRFGKVLADLLIKKYEIIIYDSNGIIDDDRVKVCELEEVLESFLVFIAVPIRSFENIVKEGNSIFYYFTICKNPQSSGK